jgi:hypothetical protein
MALAILPAGGIVPVSEFTEKFNKLMGLLEKLGFPKPQCEHIKHFPDINPALFPTPLDWWKTSYDWFIAIELIPGAEYGPFYILHGDWFWPQIGTAEIVDSEKKCFFGLQKPESVKDAQEKYNLSINPIINPMTHLYELKFVINASFLCCLPQVFIGPVKGGTGFQMNPNSLACSAIRMAIIEREQDYIGRYRVENGMFSGDREKYP